jgi:hypothetical protein
VQKKLIIHIIIVLIVCVLPTNSQTILRKNFQIMDSLINVESIRFANEIVKKNINSIELNISDNPASWLVKQHILTALTKNNIKTITENNSETPLLNINIKQIEIQYLNYENDNDSLIRNISVIIDGNLSYYKHIEIIENNSQKYKDIISRSDVDFIKSDNAFANAPVPERRKTFFEEIAVPFIVVSTAFLTVVILFTVRSG